MQLLIETKAAILSTIGHFEKLNKQISWRKIAKELKIDYSTFNNRLSRFSASDKKEVREAFNTVQAKTGVEPKKRNW